MIEIEEGIAQSGENYIKMKTAIVTIGDEILIGQIVDTNSAWMSEYMTKAGFEIEEVVSIGDNAQQIKDTIDDVSQRVDVILMTGGLGPTKDDITKKTLCEYFGTELVFDDEVLENIKNVINQANILNELTRNQAYVPKDCTVIQNRVGTAPVTWFEWQGKVLASLPGVPYEMRYSMENEIVPRLQKRFDTEAYVYQVLLVTGYSESGLAIYLDDFENNLPEGFGLAYLPSPRLIRLRLFVHGEHRRAEFDEQLQKLQGLLNGAVLSDKDIAVERLVAEKLIDKGLTIGVAESCTGGNIAHLLTSMVGSSAYFVGSVVTYSYQSKEKVLGVKRETLDRYGAVSEQTVREMVDGAQKLLDVDCAIAVSGIAGPGGGTDDKPVGTVWVAAKVKDRVVTARHQLGRYREANIMGASNVALLQLLQML